MVSSKVGTMKIVELSIVQVGLAALLILINGLVSVLLHLKLERSLLIASLRTIGQLALIGLVLEWVFALDRWYVVVILLAAMTVLAGSTALQRAEHRHPGLWQSAFVSIWASSWLVTAWAMLAVLQQIDHWYRPQYVIPLLGMVLGNSLNGVALGLNSFLQSAVRRRDEIDTALALGASRWEATREVVRHSVRTGMIPIVNSMMIVGIVSLPGMMTGQILAGNPPGQAVRYQIMIMFLIASATAIGTVSSILLSWRRLMSTDHQFLFHLIEKKPE